MIKVSVIIPVYNGEAYLHQCLDSVCAQTLKEIEIICVDDGSTDASWQILEEYRDKDPRFRLFRQEHKYLPEARNNGLEQAQGKWVIFWDCDDFFDPCALELLCQQAEELDTDICVCKHDLYNLKDGKRYPAGRSLNLKRIPKGGSFNRFTNPEHILGFTNAGVWNKLFRRSFLVENNLIFPNFRMGEDYPFTYSALCLASRITTVNKVLIHYRWNNPGSQMEKRPGGSVENFRAIDFGVGQLRQRDIVPEGLEKITTELVIRILRWTGTESDFMAGLQYLREHNLWEKFDIREREPEYYYSPRHHEYVKHLLHDEPGDVLAFFMRETWQELRIVAADRRRVKEELKQLKLERKEFTTKLKRTTKQLETKTKQLEKKTKQLEIKTKQLEKKTKQLETQKNKIQVLENSKSYRLGRMLLYLPRKMRELFRQIAHRTNP